VSDGAEEFKRFEAEGWGRKAESYASLTGALTTRVVEPLLDEAGLESGNRVLDVATGPGYVAAAALERGAEPVGIDIAEAMITVARRQYPGIEFVLGDAEELPFEADGFDVVAANFVINHLPRPERAAAEFARVLRPGGRMAFSIWDEDEHNRWYGLAAETLAEVREARTGALPAGAPDPTRFADKAEARALLAGAGLDRDFAMRRLEFSWPVPSGESLWANLMAGSVRTAARIQAQDPDAQRRIRELFTERAEREFRSGEELLLQASVMIASAGAP
jgi:SAM-dependent methyltransferase